MPIKTKNLVKLIRKGEISNKVSGEVSGNKEVSILRVIIDDYLGEDSADEKNLLQRLIDDPYLLVRATYDAWVRGKIGDFAYLVALLKVTISFRHEEEVDILFFKYSDVPEFVNDVKQLVKQLCVSDLYVSVKVQKNKELFMQKPEFLIGEIFKAWVSGNIGDFASLVDLLKTTFGSRYEEEVARLLEYYPEKFVDDVLSF